MARMRTTTIIITLLAAVFASACEGSGAPLGDLPSSHPPATFVASERSDHVDATAATSWSSRRAAADWSSAGGAIVDGSPEAVVIVGHDGEFASWSSGAPGSRWRCGYFGIAAPQHSVYDPTPIVDWAAGPLNPRAGEGYILACDDETGRRVHERYVVFDPVDPIGVATTERAVAEARRRLDLPDPTPRVNPPAYQLVGVPMWMWVDDPWDRIWATASVGATWAAVSARPVATRWDLPDGETVWCDRGVVYDIFRSPREQQSECTYVFTRNSADRLFGVIWVQVTVLWHVEWYSSEGGGEPLGTLERSATIPVRVFEAQALVR